MLLLLEKVGEKEKCVIITNSLHSTRSSEKARFRCAEFYLYL